MNDNIVVSLRNLPKKVSYSEALLWCKDTRIFSLILDDTCKSSSNSLTEMRVAANQQAPETSLWFASSVGLFDKKGNFQQEAVAKEIGKAKVLHSTYLTFRLGTFPAIDQLKLFGDVCQFTNVKIGIINEADDDQVYIPNWEVFFQQLQDIDRPYCSLLFSTYNWLQKNRDTMFDAVTRLGRVIGGIYLAGMDLHPQRPLPIQPWHENNILLQILRNPWIAIDFPIDSQEALQYYVDLINTEQFTLPIEIQDQ